MLEDSTWKSSWVLRIQVAPPPRLLLGVSQHQLLSWPGQLLLWYLAYIIGNLDALLWNKHFEAISVSSSRHVSKVNRAGMMDFLKTRPTTIIGASIVFHRYLLNHLPMAILTALLLLIGHKWRENRASSYISFNVVFRQANLSSFVKNNQYQFYDVREKSAKSDGFSVSLLRTLIKRASTRILQMQFLIPAFDEWIWISMTCMLACRKLDRKLIGHMTLNKNDP